MRYRKSKKFSALLFPPGDVVQPHHCLLSQSPWDAIPFSTDSDFDLDSRPYLLQFEKDNRFDREANNSSVPSVERDPEVAVPKKVDGETIRVEIDDVEAKEETEKDKIIDGLRPRSQRRAAKKARWLNSNTNEFYYYSDLGL